MQSKHKAMIADSKIRQKIAPAQRSIEESLVIVGDYYNAVVIARVNHSLADIKKVTRDIEEQCGRDRTCRDVVAIDIDLLLYGDIVSSEVGMPLPHPDLFVCDYVLRPLSDIRPEGVCPQRQATWRELWCAMADSKTQQQQSLPMPVDFIWHDQVISLAPPCVSL